MPYVDGEPTTCVHGIKLDTEYCGACFRSNLNSISFEAADAKAKKNLPPVTGCKHGYTVHGLCPICTPSADEVNRPAHYASAEVECIDAMRSAFGQEALENYCIIAAFKYLWRADKKGNRHQDLQKAIWYLRYATGDDPRRGK